MSEVEIESASNSIVDEDLSTKDSQVIVESTSNSVVDEDLSTENQGDEDRVDGVLQKVFGIKSSNNKKDGKTKSNAKSLSEDQGDAWGFGGYHGPGQNIAKMPVDRDSETYNMNHKRRGLAIIFNHKSFDKNLGLGIRNGTDVDRDNLSKTLKQLGFDVEAYNDLKFKDLEKILERASFQTDHTDADCIMVIVLSHGEQGILYASDKPYKTDKLWTQFNAKDCPTLAGKPKIFFIQACQGDKVDDGVRLVARTETDSGMQSYKIPSHADFLIVCSTIPGFYSWRNTTAGSWFVQALCDVLKKDGTTRDLLSILTRVNRKVAFGFQSNSPSNRDMHEKKQISCITAMLTREIYFANKKS